MLLLALEIIMQPFENNLQWHIYKEFLLLIILRRNFQKSFISGEKNCGTAL